MMKKRILTMFFVIACISMSMAQKQQDFIISLTKDTIFGEISLYDAPNVTFKYHKKKLQFHPSSIGYFGIHRNGTYQLYRSIKNAKGAYAIVKVIDEGTIKLYEYRKRPKLQATFASNSFYMIGLTDQKLITLSPGTFAKVIGGFMKDEPNIMGQLASATYQHIPQLIETYNQLQVRHQLELLTQNINTK